MLTSGQTAHVSQVMGDRDTIQRLAELGMCQGTHVEMVRHGSPCIVRHSGGKYCFRDGDALRVLVEVGQAG